MKKLLIALFAVLLLFSCKEPKTVRIGANLWPGYEPLFVAETLGFFDKKVRMIEYTSASEVIRAFKNNNLEMAALTLDEAIYLSAEGFDIKIVLVLDISHGADVIITRKNIRKPADLKGKRVGVEYTALGAYVLARFLEKNNMTVQDIVLVPIEVDRHESAFLSGEVDAVVTFEPVKTALLKKDGVVLFDSTHIPEEILDVLVVRSDIYKKNKDVIKVVREGWFQTVDIFKTDISSIAELIYPRLRLTEKELEKTYEGLVLGGRRVNAAMLDGTPAQIDQIIAELYKVMKENKIIDQPLPKERLY